MTRSIKTLYSLLTILLLLSCSDGRSEYPSVITELVVAETNDEGRLSVIRVDDGPILNVSKIRRSSLPTDVDALIRSVALYRQNSDFDEVEIYDIAPVPVIVPTIALESTVDHQYPVTYIRGWVAGGFLNLELGIKAVKLNLHTVGFTEVISDIPNVIQLEFTHDKGGDIDGATQEILISIPLQKYDELFSDKDYVIELKLNTFNKGVISAEFKP